MINLTSEGTANLDHVYEDKQYGYCNVRRNDAGFTVSIKFSNGKKVDGDHFSCDVVLRYGDGTAAAAVQFKCGLNPAYFGGSREKEMVRQVELTPSERDAVAGVDIVYGQYDTSNDSEIWKAVGEAVKKIVETYFDKTKKDPPTHSGGSRVGP